MTTHDSNMIGNLRLVNLRSLTLVEQTRWLSETTNQFKMLTANLAVEREPWSQLPRWEQNRIRAMAVGRSSYSAVLVGKSAARIWRMPILESHQPVELCAPGHTSAPSSSQWPTGVIYRSWRLPPQQILEWQGLRVTTRYRTLFDVIRTSNFAQGLALMDQELREKPGSLTEYRHRFKTFGRAHGTRMVWQVLQHATSLAESPLESKARAQLIEVALPEVTSTELQAPVNGTSYRVDMRINGWLGIELDGAVKYLQHPEQAIRDERAREKRIQNTGMRLLRFHHADLNEHPNQPSRFITEVTQALRQANQLTA